VKNARTGGKRSEIEDPGLKEYGGSSPRKFPRPESPEKNVWGIVSASRIEERSEVADEKKRKDRVRAGLNGKHCGRQSKIGNTTTTITATTKTRGSSMA